MAGITSNYAYDAIYQLTQVAQGASTTESYSYDAVGNRLSSLGVSPYSYNPSNEMVSTPTAMYVYDANGNTTSKTDSTGTTSYAWDYENRLTSVTLPTSGGAVSFKYDPFGRRIEKSSSSGATIFAYDGDNIVEEANGSGAVQARYTGSGNIDEPLAESRSSVTSYYQADGLGSVTSLSNAAGALAQTYSFDSFGKTTPTGSLVNPFQYTGRELDAETGLYYYRARYYEPNAGKFLSEDPLEFHGGINFYGYVENNASNFVDPTGYVASSPCLNIDTFVQWLDDHAHKRSQHHCAAAVRQGLEAGGLNMTGRPDAAKDYGPLLESKDFSPVSSDNYSPRKGDVVVIQPGPNPAGHIEAWDGNTWVSDFAQHPNKISPYKGPTPSYTIYRSSNPCPTPSAGGFWQYWMQKLLSWF